MESVILLAVWMRMIWVNRKDNKSTSVLLLLTLFIVPTVAIGNVRISATYFWIVFFLFLIIRNRSELKISTQLLRYVMFMGALMLIYILAWGINGNSGGILGAVIGDGKFLVLALELGILLQEESRELWKQHFGKALNITLIVNTVVICVQLLFPSLMVNVIQRFFYDDNSINQIDSMRDGVYSRLLGIYTHPAYLAIFSLFVIAYYFPAFGKNKKVWPYLLCGFLCGAGSMSKTFVLGFPLLLLLWLLSQIKYLRDKRVLILFVTVVSVILLVMIQYESIHSFLYERSQVVAYYFSFLHNPLKAFATRYSSKTGILLPIYEIIRKHPIIGVGPLAVKGEILADSAPIIILHNGGVIALLIVILFYLWLFYCIWKCAGMEEIFLWFTVIMSGFALSTWTFYLLTYPVLMYLILFIGKKRESVPANDRKVREICGNKDQ